MTAPSTIAEILSGPHLRELVTDCGRTLLIIEPLQFFQVLRQGTSERVADMPVRT